MSKLSRLRNNIAALEHAMQSTSGYDYEILNKYTGFGGMNFLLNPMDKSAWNKSDLLYYEDTERLHKLLREESASEQEYSAWMQSLKASVLTAYYTPEQLTGAIFCAIIKPQWDGGMFMPEKILDPAAGATGVFLNNALWRCHMYSNNPMRVAYEKDLLSGLILSRLCDSEDMTHYFDGQHNSSYKTKVHVDGFENIPQEELGKYDLVSTNVPFGDIKVFDPEYSNSKSAVRREAARFIHRYYVLKGLDCLRDGGIEAYIITSNYLNRDTEQLAEALKQSRLIGAYRFGNNLFKEAGTEVGTDLLVLQKHIGKNGLTADESMLLTTYEDGGCPTNLYFECYQDHVIATDKAVDTDAYGKPGFVYTHRNGVEGMAKDMGKVLAEDMEKNFDVVLYKNPSQNARKSTAEKEHEHRTAMELAILHLHKTYKALYEYEAKEMQENTELRRELNEKYDEFYKEFGPLNYTANKYHVEQLKVNDLLGLEIHGDNGMWQKADILLKPVAFATDDLHEADTAQEALAQSLNDYGKPDMQYMMAMTGKTEEEILDELHDEVFYNPLNDEFEIMAKFICGDVISKAEQIKALNHSNPSRSNYSELVKHSLAALEAAAPEPIPFDELDFNLGERWVSPEIYGRFASEFFSMPEDDSWRGGAVNVTVRYDRMLDQYAVTADTYNQKIWTQYSVKSEATSSIDGMGMLVHALHNTCPKMMKYQRDEDGCRIKDASDKGWLKEEDSEATQLANTKVEEIRQGYVDWLLRQPQEFRDELADKYNRKFNCFVKPKYDGSHQKFPGLSRENLAKDIKGFKDLYQSQKDCIWMLVLNGGGICDHEVGGGKTLIMCVAAHEMKRLGLAHKPMIIGLKANVDEIARTYKTAYPQAKVLYASAKDYSASERVDFFNRMKNNDWDCVIMSHDQFGRIPQSDEVQMELLADEVRQIDESLAALNGMEWKITNQLRKGLERRKRNKEAEIQRLLHSIRENKDNVVDFQMMGIDHIFVDESHQFKNLGFSTRHDRVAGMGNTEGSKRAFNLLMAIRTIQKRTGRDLGATFLSGTTVTNSLTELYGLFRYLRPKALKEQGITCFDAWAAIYTKKSSEYEFGITNQIILKERFRYFIKVPELAMFYNMITDFRTAEDVGIERPEKHAMLLHIEPTPDQNEFIDRLMKFAKSGDFSLIGIESPSDKQRKAKMLYATDLARKMSLDMRMIDQAYDDHPRNKASKCAMLIKQYYDKYDAQKGTQMVFSDLSTWQGAGKGWNVYEEIKRKLVEDYGIPENEVRFIQECKCESKKQALIKQVNEGKVRVLFGSTSMLGTGVNAQQRVVAVHHLDTPWRPSDLEQRDGRAIRKGNEVARDYADNKVDIIIYAVKRSLDAYKFNLLHCKQTFINQLKRGQLAKRTLDEGAMDENTGMNFAEYMAVLSGNTDLLERAKLEKKIAGLESERKNYLREQREQVQKIASLNAENEKHEQNIKDARRDWEKFSSEAKTDADGQVVNDIQIDNYTVPAELAFGTDEWLKAVGEQLFSIEKKANTSGAHIRIGSVCGFPIVVRTTHTMFDDECVYDNYFFVEGDRLRYSKNSGKLNHASARVSATFPLQALQSIPDIIKGWESKIEQNKMSISQLQTITGQPWKKESDLRKLKSDLAILDRKINEGIKNERKQEHAADSQDIKAAA